MQKATEATYLGLVIGDTFAVPSHWYYNVDDLKRDYGVITEITGPRLDIPHPFGLVGSFSYNGSIDILHDKKKYYGTHPATGNPAENQQKNGDPGKVSDPFKDDIKTVHYHLTLKKGQNTHNVAVARMLARSLHTNFETADKSKFFEVYDPAQYLDQFEKFTSANPADFGDDVGQINTSNDLYYDRYVRRYFENRSNGVPSHACSYNQRKQWSIGSLDGIVMALPLVLAYINEPEGTLVARAIEHQFLTHRSVTVSAGLAVIVPLLQKLIFQQSNPDPSFNLDQTLDEAMDKLKPPKITQKEIMQSYMAAKGPDNIPTDEKWQQHMEHNPTMTLKDFVRKHVANGSTLADTGLGSLCYVEHALAVVFFLLCVHGKDAPQEAIVQNVLFGGHTTARSALLGSLLGAIHGKDAFKESWLKDIAAPEQVMKEAEDLGKLAVARV